MYACESWTLTAELEKRTQAFEMRSCRRLLNISYKDHVTNEDVRRKIKAAIGKYDGQETETKVVLSHLKVFWLSKDDSAGNSARKKKKNADRRGGGQTIISSGQGWALLAQLGQLKTGLGGKGLL